MASMQNFAAAEEGRAEAMRAIEDDHGDGARSSGQSDMDSLGIESRILAV
jgi:hypothetical protein